MTTIAYDGRYIAADGRETYGNMICEDFVDKSIVTSSGIFFLAGGASDCIKFSKSFIVDQKTDIDDDTIGFLFKEDACFMVGISDGVFWDYDQTGKPFSVGSGSQFAIAAIDHGKSAVDAVRYAITRDCKSGGKITCFDTKTKKFIKVKQ